MNAIESRALADLHTIVDQWDASPFAAIDYEVSRERRLIKECLELASRLANQSTPEGFVLVPVVPTADMARAFTAYRPIERAGFFHRYEEMIAARPEVSP